MTLWRIPDERLAFVEIGVKPKQFARCDSLQRGHIDGRKYSPVHGNQMRGERDRHFGARQQGKLLFDLGDMPVHAPTPYALKPSFTSQNRLSTLALRPAPDTPDLLSAMMVAGIHELAASEGAPIRG